MTLWKVNEKHLNCMITQAEMKELGFELSELQIDKEKTDAFLQTILESGKKLFELDTKDGIRSFNATLLQNESVLVSISCAGPDEEIDKSLEEIEHDMEVIKTLTTKENMTRLKELKGAVKAQEFGEFVAKLKRAFERHNKPIEQIEVAIEKEKKVSPVYHIKFPSLDNAIEFCHYYSRMNVIQSSLFKHDNSYYLAASFYGKSAEKEKKDFVIQAEEFNGEFEENPYLQTIIEEHGDCMIRKQAMSKLRSL